MLISLCSSEEEEARLRGIESSAYFTVHVSVLQETDCKVKKMASKLRRTPLFGYDGNLGIPILPPAASSAAANAQPKAKKNGFQVRRDFIRDSLG